MHLSIERRFIRKVDVRGDDDCWLWQASLDRKGYGQFGLNNTMVRAHRVAYFIRYGEIPEYAENGAPLFVCHKCDNPSCCNPKHLFLGTNADNMRDAAEKNRMPRGANNPNAKLAEKNIEQIKQLLSKGISQEKIAKLFGIAQSTISKISSGKRWKHLNEGGD